MFVKDTTEKTITLETEPEPKLAWRIRALNFADLEQIDATNGLFPVFGATVAQLLSGGADSVKVLSDGEKTALQAIGAWTAARNTLIALSGVVGCGDQNFAKPSDVKDFFLKLRPLSAVRSVIDELAKKILEFSDLCDIGDEKKD